MSTLGLFNTTNFAPNELPKSFASRILTKYPGSKALLTALSAKFTKENIPNHHHHWMSKSMVFPKGKTTANIPASSAGRVTQIEVDDATDFVPGAVLLVIQTQEQMRVESILGANTLMVRRQFGISIAQPIPAGSDIWQIGTAHEEGSLRPLAKTYSSVEYDNITQIFRNSWGVTGTVAAETTVYGEQVHARTKAEAAMYHAIDMEMAYLFGERHQTVLNGQPLRKMDGILSTIKQHAPQNIKYAGKTTGFKQLSEMTGGVFDVASDQTSENDRLLLVGNRAYSVINAIGREYADLVTMSEKESVFGMKFTEFTTDSGTFKLMKHPLFNLNETWSRMALILDPGSCGIHNLRNTVHNTFNANVNSESQGSEDGQDATGGTYLTECLLANYMPEANGVIYGLCEASKDVAITTPLTYSACMNISHPCHNGTVVGGSTVFLSMTGFKPSMSIQVATPTGTATINVDANGNGSTAYTMPTTPGHYSFAYILHQDAMNVTVSSPVVTACVSDCVQVQVGPNSPEAAVCDGVVDPQPLGKVNVPTDIIVGANSTQS